MECMIVPVGTPCAGESGVAWERALAPADEPARLECAECDTAPLTARETEIDMANED